MNDQYALISCDKLLTLAIFKPFITVSHIKEWSFIQASNGELPEAANISKYKAFVIGGSTKSVNEKLPWIEKLENFVRNVIDYQLKNHDAPKLLGICFGHQVICKVLGAKIVNNHCGNYLFRLENIFANEEMKAMNCYKEVFGEEDSFVLFKSHSEEVIELPKSVKVLASSNNCQYEVLTYGDKCLTFQSHMDLTNEQFIGLVYSILKRENQLDEQEEEVFWDNFIKKQNDREKIIRMMIKYIEE